MIRANVDVLHVPLQLEFQRLKLIGNRSLLSISEFNANEHSVIGQASCYMKQRMAGTPDCSAPHDMKSPSVVAILRKLDSMRMAAR